MITHRPDGIDFMLLKVRTDLEHTPAHIAPLIRVDRLHLASILAYVTHLEDRVQELRQEMEDNKPDENSGRKLYD